MNDKWTNVYQETTSVHTDSIKGPTGGSEPGSKQGNHQIKGKKLYSFLDNNILITHTSGLANKIIYPKFLSKVVWFRTINPSHCSGMAPQSNERPES